MALRLLQPTPNASAMSQLAILARFMLSTLVEPDWSYWRWLRLAILRLLACISTCKAMKAPSPCTVWLVRIGVENAKKPWRAKACQDLCKASKQLNEHGQQHQPAHRVTCRLNRNLDLISAELGVNATERHVFGLAVLIHAEPILEATFDLYGSCEAHACQAFCYCTSS